ncbi:MAG: type II toxin-antitoxin system PemK/MazF family toxin [Pseudoleptotrichia goodfellowii]|nr:type II toxin-antitoxin system PemK/MazF family toxin [Pseudoleptotrichia goodfellowii]
MEYELLGVYLVDFMKNLGGEISGRHYALVISRLSNKDGTLLVAPITSKKQGKKYRGGFTIDCTKYQKNPSYKNAFIKIRKMREIDKIRIQSRKIYSLDEEDTEKLKEAFYKFFYFLN